MNIMKIPNPHISDGSPVQLVPLDRMVGKNSRESLQSIYSSLQSREATMSNLTPEASLPSFSRLGSAMHASQDASRNNSMPQVLEGVASLPNLPEFNEKDLPQPSVRKIPVLDTVHHSNVLDRMQQFDMDGNGKISFDEFGKACNHFNKPMSKGKLKSLFKKMDKDESGYIEFAEFMTSDLMHWEKTKIPSNGKMGRGALGHENAGAARVYGSAEDRAKEARERIESMHNAKDASAKLAMEVARSKLRGNRYATGLQMVRAFQFFDSDGNGTLSTSEVKEALKALKVPAKPSVVNELVSAFDKNGDGLINYAEFCASFVGTNGSAATASLYKPTNATVL